MEKLKFIENLRDYHKNEEIWIIGCGQSLCDFPKRFFSRKITIALNWAITAFPNCTYWHGHHECFREYLRDEKPEFLEKSIILFPFPGSFKHGRITDPREFFGKLVSKPIWMKFWDTRPIPRSAFEDIIKCIMEKRIPSRGYRASMTIAHTAIQAAAVMGTKKITLVGCEHQGLHAFYKGRRLPNDPRYETGTRWSAEIFSEYGIEVVRYFYKNGPYYKKGYAKIKQS